MIIIAALRTARIAGRVPAILLCRNEAKKKHVIRIRVTCNAHTQTHCHHSGRPTFAAAAAVPLARSTALIVAVRPALGRAENVGWRRRRCQSGRRTRRWLGQLLVVVLHLHGRLALLFAQVARRLLREAWRRRCDGHQRRRRRRNCVARLFHVDPLLGQSGPVNVVGRVGGGGSGDGAGIRERWLRQPSIVAEHLCTIRWLAVNRKDVLLREHLKQFGGG